MASNEQHAGANKPEVEKMASRQRCAKCGGNLFATEDQYSAYLACLQCGSTVERTLLGSLDEALEETLRPARARLGLAPARATVR